MRGIIHAEHLAGAMVGIVVLAFLVNLVSGLIIMVLGPLLLIRPAWLGF